MREIDPQSETRLTEALRHLAASSPQRAPVEVGAGLATAFRRHHARRRLARRVRLAAIAACLVLTASLWMLMPSRFGSDKAVSDTSSNKVPNVVASTAAPSAEEAHSVAKTTALPVVPVQPRPAPTKRTLAKAPKIQTGPAINRQFVALSAYDPRLPLDELRVFRVRLPANALWQMGAPFNSGTSNRRILADFVVGQDGTPYAVRLLQ